MKIEDYGFIGDMHTGALVGSNGSIDWLCMPKFGSDACFAALLGTPENGFWKIAPCGRSSKVRRKYQGDSLVLETEFKTSTGSARLVDFMPIGQRHRQVVRMVEGIKGHVSFALHLVIRFDYGNTVPWVRKIDGLGISAVAGPSALSLRSDVPLEGKGMSTVAQFEVRKGQRRSFTLFWHRSNEAAPFPKDGPAKVLKRTLGFWENWAKRCRYHGPWRPALIRSLLTLKALTYKPTGGIVAALTTSLPERLGGERNWDYRFCWLRDATFTLYSFMIAGYHEEASAWCQWLMRAIAGDASQLQIVYGVSGERPLLEYELDHLQGYAKSTPVRVGNAASMQFQLDVYGEVLDAMHTARANGIRMDDYSWSLERHLVRFVIEHWQDPDEGIWEVRGKRRHFTHSKVMAWVAMDRAVKAVEQFGLKGDLKSWKAVRNRIHDDVCKRGFNRSRGAFTQSYGSASLDASLLMMPLVGFLPIMDPRVQSTVDLIQKELLVGGLVQRYESAGSKKVDGLPPGEGTFLPCSFWLVDCLHLSGRQKQAQRLFERLLKAQNDLGLLSEEFDPKSGRQLGNFPQAFSHVGLVNSSYYLSPRMKSPSVIRGTAAPMGSALNGRANMRQRG